ncbi:glycoside hydrolase superfamily [Dichotomopilus funicola]|uniref:beta-galactosidase n=1 Tax=Dichotomopilus funicola TaxID=1934379 RepID=A0AAN6ZHW8_9PEZI|nr:glycoside hydrolase superfamily [Dichotomopilus funicola]
MGVFPPIRGLSAKLISFLLLMLVSNPRLTSAAVAADEPSDAWPILDNGLQDTVQWDHHSILIHGERMFLFGGEMHPFRLPIPELWEDVLQKIKATGLRMVSIYTHWGFHAPTPDTVDFTSGSHNLTRFLEMAKDVGLYVLVRPGPYINAELSAGGMALWATTGAHGELRVDDEEFAKAWTPYQDGFAQLTEPFQVTEEGTVVMYQIENEYAGQWTNAAEKTPNEEGIGYMEALEKNARDNGIVVPLVHNMPNMNGRSWSKDYDTVGAGGNVDIYGLDSYPQCWSCVQEECGSTPTPFGVLDYYDHFQLVSPNQPSFMPEFQGGALNPWNGPSGGCRERTGVDFVNFYYRDTISQHVTMLNLYMIYGGTNWGWLAAPFLGSSYDYSAAISEDRSVGDKYYELKNLGLFTRVADELAYTERIGNGTDYTNNTNLHTAELRNPETGAGFYVIRHDDTASDAEEWYAWQVNCSLGQFFVPKISSAFVLSGNEAKIMVADFHFGEHTLSYSSVEVLTYSVIDEKPVLVLWAPVGRSGEFHLRGATNGTIVSGQAVTLVSDEEGMIVGYIQKEGLTVVEFDNGVRVVLVDRATAYKVWSPALTNDPKVPVNQTALVIGPRLVRSATLTSEDSTISLFGDNNATTPTALEVFTSSSITTIRWNGVDLPTTQSKYSSLLATINPDSSTSSPTFQPPKITNWKSQDSLPEISPSYSDSGPAWVLANDSTTTNPDASVKDATKPYLFADQYGFHTGIRLWRGRFLVATNDSGAAPTGVYLAVQGGTAHGWSAYLNGGFLGSWLGSADAAVGNLTLEFGDGVLQDGENVLLVIHDDTGHDQGDGAVTPRGILNATLLSEGEDGEFAFTEWRVAGTAGAGGGKKAGLDAVRTHYNEGGLTGERLGWHLPGFDDGKWEEGDGPSAGFGAPGVRFYRGALPLDVPKELDVSLAFRFKPAAEGKLGYRVLLFVNGWQYGRYYPSIASEDTFPVPIGVLDYAGDNIVALAVWALQEDGASVDVEVVTRYAVESSLDVRFDGSYLRPGWDSKRLDYV